jgi:hypothetical protein
MRTLGEPYFEELITFRTVALVVAVARVLLFILEPLHDMHIVL